jgi:transcription factor MYB, plant
MAATQSCQAAACFPAAVAVDEEHGHHSHQLKGGAQEEAENDNKPELRRGPWTVDEDLTLVNYIADNGEGRWNNLARAAGTSLTHHTGRSSSVHHLDLRL